LEKVYEIFRLERRSTTNVRNERKKSWDQLMNGEKEDLSGRAAGVEEVCCIASIFNKLPC
jgi:hypothetical protein